MIHRPRGHARTRCLVWSQQSPLEFFQYGSGRPCARVSRVLTKATSYLIALSLQPKEVGNDNRAEAKNDGEPRSMDLDQTNQKTRERRQGPFSFVQKPSTLRSDGERETGQSRLALQSGRS